MQLCLRNGSLIYFYISWGFALRKRQPISKEIFNSKQHGKSPNGIWTKGAGDYKNYGKINYVNNGGGAQIFHIYVPIAVKYAWGNVKYSNTNEQTSGVKTNLDYTQKVWAVITVNKTVNSGAKRH